ERNEEIAAQLALFRLVRDGALRQLLAEIVASAVQQILQVFGQEEIDDRMHLVASFLQETNRRPRKLVLLVRCEVWRFVKRRRAQKGLISRAMAISCAPHPEARNDIGQANQ